MPCRTVSGTSRHAIRCGCRRSASAKQVCFGNAEQVSAFRERWMRSLAMFSSLLLPADTDAANDHFFGRFRDLRADGQRSQRLKGRDADAHHGSRSSDCLQ